MTLLSDGAYRELKRRLVLWEYAPGRRLPEDGIAAEFGVSRTPVRDALRRLEREGFLEYEPHSGYRARTPNLARIQELYEVRLALEETAVRRLAAAPVRHSLDELLAEWEPPGQDLPASDPDLLEADERFHESLALLAGNRPLAEMLRSINEHIRVIRANDFVTPKRIADTYRQHRAVLRALRRGDADGAAARLRAHILESQAHVWEAAERALSRVTIDAARATPRRARRTGAR